MELKIGMYVRTKKGNIGKITFISPLDGLINLDTESYSIGKHFIKKASYDIIDLIEKNDVILGKDGLIYQVDKVWKDYVFTKTKNKYEQIVTLVDYQIDKILTHEQFESISYKVGE